MNGHEYEQLFEPSLRLVGKIRESGIDVLDGRYYPSREQLESITEEYGIELVGFGDDCFVLSSDELRSENRVMAVHYSSITEDTAHSIFHRQNILSTLFPYNFPRLHEMVHIPHDTFGIGPMWASIRERIYGQKRKKLLWQGSTNFSHIDRGSTYPFATAWNKMMELSLPYRSPDMAGENFMLGDDGGTYYVDILKMDHERIGTWDYDSITEHMYSVGFDFGVVQSILGSIQTIIDHPTLHYDYSSEGGW